MCADYISKDLCDQWYYSIAHISYNFALCVTESPLLFSFNFSSCHPLPPSYSPSHNLSYCDTRLVLGAGFNYISSPEILLVGTGGPLTRRNAAEVSFPVRILGIVIPQPGKRIEHEIFPRGRALTWHQRGQIIRLLSRVNRCIDSPVAAYTYIRLVIMHALRVKPI